MSENTSTGVQFRLTSQNQNFQLFNAPLFELYPGIQARIHSVTLHYRCDYDNPFLVTVFAEDQETGHLLENVPIPSSCLPDWLERLIASQAARVRW